MKKLTFIIFVLFSLQASIQGFAQDEDGYPLPFLEQWNNGTFGTNNWLPEGENWSINWQEGQPDPSAEFTWDPIQNDYQIALESYPLLADSMTEGDIYLDYDIKLDNYNPTGTEEMLVQVWNWDSQEWATVSTYSNDDGSFDWMSEHLNITSQAIETIFKIRFAASGENSLNILGWFVDNIHVYRVCKAPKNLEVEAISDPEAMLLNWENPFGPDDEWIEWDDGINSGNSIGTNDEVEFDVASRWTTSQLSEYEGSEITQIAFFPAETQATYNVRVWTGPGAGNLVIDQPVSDPVIGQWNFITLDSPQMIDISQELWVGYYVNTQTGYPAGVDDGPAIDGYGNMMNFGGWQTLLEINPSMNYNWNLKAFIQRSYSVDTVAYYAIYRSDNGGPFYYRGYSEVEEFVDDSSHLLSNCPFCYYVTAIYSSELDWCESGPTDEACELCPWGIQEEQISGAVEIYPNPASDVLFIESSEKIESIILFDSRGITMEQWNNGTLEQWKGETVKIPVNGLAPGLYFVRVETGGEMVVRKMVIRR